MFRYEGILTGCTSTVAKELYVKEDGSTHPMYTTRLGSSSCSEVDGCAVVDILCDGAPQGRTDASQTVVARLLNAVAFAPKCATDRTHSSLSTVVLW